MTKHSRYRPDVERDDPLIDTPAGMTEAGGTGPSRDGDDIASTDMSAEPSSRGENTQPIFRGGEEPGLEGDLAELKDRHLRLAAEFEELNLPRLVKLAYEVDDGDATDREHLWFEVHRILDGRVDATLANEPFRIAAMKAGQRAEYDLDRLTDWAILSPEGQMSPRNFSAARRLRENYDTWKGRLANQAGPTP